MRKKALKPAADVPKTVPTKRLGSKRWARLIAKVFLVDPHSLVPKSPYLTKILPCDVEICCCSKKANSY